MKDEIKEFEEFRNDEDGTYFYYIDKDGNEQWSYKLDNLKDYITNLQEEIPRSNNIIDDLEKWLNDEIIRIKNISKKVKVPPYGQEKEYYEKYISSYSMVLDKLKALKEGKK